MGNIFPLWISCYSVQSFFFIMLSQFSAICFLYKVIPVLTISLNICFSIFDGYKSLFLCSHRCHRKIIVEYHLLWPWRLVGQFLFFFFFKIIIIYLRGRESMCTSGGWGRGRGRSRLLLSRALMRSTIPEPQNHHLSQRQLLNILLSHPGPPSRPVFRRIFLYISFLDCSFPFSIHISFDLSGRGSD